MTLGNGVRVSVDGVDIECKQVLEVLALVADRRKQRFKLRRRHISATVK